MAATAASFTVVFVRPEIATGSYNFATALSSSASGSKLHENEPNEEEEGGEADTQTTVKSSIPGVTAIEAACLLPNGQVVRILRQRFLQQGFQIASQRQIQLTRADVRTLFRYERERLTDASAFSEFVDGFTRAPCLVLLLEHPTEDAVAVADELLGLWDPVIARKEALSSSMPHDQWPLRALCGHTALQNGLQSSVNRDCAYRERFFAFPPQPPRLERALVVLLPPFLTAFPEGKALLMAKLNQQQTIVTHSLEAQELSAEEIALLTKATSSEAADRDPERLQQLCGSGPSSMILGLEGLDLIFTLRAVLGPVSIQTARVYASDSVRAQFPTAEDSEMLSPAQSNDALSLETGTLVVWDLDTIVQLLKDKGVIETTLGLIKPGTASDPEAVASIQHSIRAFGFTIEKQRRLRLSRDQAASFYGEHVGKPFFERLVAFMTSGEIVAMQLTRTHAIRCWRGLMGPTNALLARETHPWTLRARFGIDGTRNATHGSDAVASARRELRFFFGEHLHAMLPAFPGSAFTAAQVARSCLPPPYAAGQTLEKVLTEGMSEMLALKMQDPLEACRWLGQWLLRQRDRQLGLTARENETEEHTLSVSAGMPKTKPPAKKPVQAAPDGYHPSGSIVLAFAFTDASVNLETRTSVCESVQGHAMAHDYEFLDVRSLAAKQVDPTLAMRSVVSAMNATGKRRFVLFDLDLERFASVFDQQAQEHDLQMTTLVQFTSASKPSNSSSGAYVKPWVPRLTHELSVVAEDRAAVLQSMLAGVFEPSVVIVHDDPKHQIQWRAIAQHFGFRICVFDDLVDRKVEQERQPSGPWTQWKRTRAKLQPELVLSLIQQLIHRPFQLFGGSGNQQEENAVSCANRLLLLGFPWQQLAPNAIEQAIGSPLHRVVHVRGAGSKEIPWMMPFAMRGLVQILDRDSDAGLPLERLTETLVPIVGLCMGQPLDHDRIHSRLQSHLSGHQFSWISFYDLESALGSTELAMRTLRQLLLAGNVAGRKRMLVYGFPRTKAEAELWLNTLPRPSFVAVVAPAKVAVDEATRDALSVFAADPHIRQAEIGLVDDPGTAALVHGLLLGKRVSCVVGDHSALQLSHLRSMLGPSGFSVLDLRSVSDGLTTRKLVHIVDSVAATHAPRCLLVGGFDSPAFFKALEDRVGTAVHRLVLLKQIPIQPPPRARRKNTEDGEEEDYDSDEEERERMRLAQARAWSPAMLELQQSFEGSSASTWRVAPLAFMHVDRLYTQIQSMLWPHLVAIVGHPSTFYAQAVATCCRRRQIAWIDVQAISSQLSNPASASRSTERKQMQRPYEKVLTIFKKLVAETAYAAYCLDGFPREVESTTAGSMWPSVVQQLWSVEVQVAPMAHLFQFTASTDVLEERKDPGLTRYDLEDALDTLAAETKELVAYFTGRKGLKVVTISCERELADAEEDMEEALTRYIH